MAEFKNGDIVRLKSGGPEMTVNDLLAGCDPPEINCSWFNGGKHESAKFHPDTLERGEGSKQQVGESTPFIPRTFENAEQFEAAKMRAIHAMFLSACELAGIADPDDVDGVKKALSILGWSPTKLDRAVETTQQLLRLPAEQQAALLRLVQPDEGGDPPGR